LRWRTNGLLTQSVALDVKFRQLLIANVNQHVPVKVAVQLDAVQVGRDFWHI
jgi:hypothetical protein